MQKIIALARFGCNSETKMNLYMIEKRKMWTKEGTAHDLSRINVYTLYYMHTVKVNNRCFSMAKSVT